MTKKILYFYPSLSSFIQKDLDILSKRYRLISKGFSSKKKWAVPFQFASQKLFLLKHIYKTDLIICRFGGYHSFLPALYGKIFGVPVLIIQGAQESIYFPSIQTGNYTIPLYGFITKLSLRLATHFAPVDESLVECDYDYDPSGAPKQGYRVFCPKAKAPYTVIYNGYDDKLFYRNKNVERVPNSFLTVALSVKGREFFRKGIDMIFAVASEFPDSKFTIVGASENSEIAPVPSNVVFLPKVQHHELMNLYSAHEFYLQISMAEGFPNSLCEAMLCECIPIGSAVFGIPKIIDDCGYLLKKKDVNLFRQLIEAALKSDKKALSERARKHVIDNFPIQRREKELVDLIEKLTKDGY